MLYMNSAWLLLCCCFMCWCYCWAQSCSPTAVGPWLLCYAVLPAQLMFNLNDLLPVYCSSSRLQANPHGNDPDLSACAGLTFSSRDSLLQWSNTEKWGLVLTFLAFAICLVCHWKLLTWGSSCLSIYYLLMRRHSQTDTILLKFCCCTLSSTY